MNPNVLQAGAGVAFKPRHFDALLADTQRVDFIEIHAENYFGEGGLLHAQLWALRQRLPLSIHGVGLSLGGIAPLDLQHLQRLKQLCERYEPALVSEHLAWSMHAGRYFGDLLPLPYSATSVQRVAARIEQVQETLGRQILIENPSAYLHMGANDMNETEMSESEFLRLLCQRTGCGLLLDLNNLIVSSHNCGGDPLAYLTSLPVALVEEIHLAGHTRISHQNGEIKQDILIDEHASAVADVTWNLYVEWLLRASPRPTVIEWDRQLPSWPVLAAEVDCTRALQCNPYMPPKYGKGACS